MSVLPIRLESGNYGRLMIVALLGAAGAVFFLSPYTLMLFVCLFAVVSPTKDFKWLFLVTACVLFTMLNIPKQLDDDLVSYISLQDYMSVKSFFTLFDQDEMRGVSGTYRITEMAFYAPLWMLARVLPDSEAALAVFATLGIYLPTFLGLALIGKSENWSRGFLLTVAALTFFAGINFVSSTHLMRQYISASLFFYAFALYLSKRRAWSVMAALCACAVHNGTAPLVPILVIACWLFPYRPGRRLTLAGAFVRIVSMVLVLAAMMVAVPFAQGVVLKEVIPNITVWHYIAIGGFYLVAHAAIQMQRLRFRSFYYARVLFIVIYVLSLGFFVLGVKLFALRYIAYLEWLYGLLAGGIMFSMFKNRPALQVIARFTVAMAAAGFLVMRITVSTFMFGPGDNAFLSWNFFDVVQLVSR